MCQNVGLPSVLGVPVRRNSTDTLIWVQYCYFAGVKIKTGVGEGMSGWRKSPDPHFYVRNCPSHRREGSCWQNPHSLLSPAGLGIPLSTDMHRLCSSGDAGELQRTVTQPEKMSFCLSRVLQQ